MSHIFLVLGITTLYSFGLLDSRKGRMLFVCGSLLNLAYVIYRWTGLTHLPITCKHDILITMAFLASVSYFYVYRIKKLEGIMSVLPLIPVLFSVLSVFQERMETINPNMASSWFYLYMTLFVLGFTLLGIGSVLGIQFLRNDSPLLELLQYRFTLTGWLLFSFSLVFGSVWFYLSYGVYWLWTAKELWTTIVWFYYGFYLHARFVSALKGAPASEIGSVGFIVMLFAYIGVTPILGSPWTQF